MVKKQSKRIQRGFTTHPEWREALANVRIVLVGTTHAGNIGAVARVMKNMALKNLTLVSSTDAGAETEAFPMSSGAYDIVEQAHQTGSLSEALADCVMAVGTSARIGRKRSNAGVPEEIIPELMQCALLGPVAVVFGRESKGLSNEELALCTHHVIVPTDAEFASMNLAQACAITAYEVFKIACKPRGFQAKRFRPASVSAREQMFEQLQNVLIRAGFLDAANPLRMMREVRRILNSADMDDRDVTIVRGMGRKVHNMIRIADERLKELDSGKSKDEVNDVDSTCPAGNGGKGTNKTA